MKRIFLPFFILFCGGCILAHAQKNDSTLTRSMTIERNFSPIQRDANKIDHMPAVSEIKVKKSPTRYADWLAGEAISSDLARQNAGQVIAKPEKYRNGFVEASAGNNINADLKAGLNLNKDFSVELCGNAFSANLNLPEDEFIYPTTIGTETINYPKWESKWFEGDIKVNYHHLFDNNYRLRANIIAGGRKYRLLPFNVNPKGFLPKNNVGNQHVGRVWGFASLDKDNWHAEVDLRHTGILFPDMNDDGISLRGSYGWYDEDGWQAKVGVDLGIDFSANSPFSFYPELEFSKFFDDSLDRVYANIKGGIVKHDLYELMTEMPMVLPNDHDQEIDLFNVDLGYESNENGQMKWGAYVGAKLTIDRRNGFMTNSGDFMHGEFRQTDEFELKGGAYFDSEINKFFGIKGNADFSTNPRFGKPMLAANLHCIVRNLGNLTFDFGVDSAIKRDMDFVSDNNNTLSIDLGNVFDMNLRADYQVAENFSVCLFGKNLLNQKYQLWAGVPAQGINIHAGFYWRF